MSPAPFVIISDSNNGEQSYQNMPCVHIEYPKCKNYNRKNTR